MKRILTIIVACGVSWIAGAADPAVGVLPNGQFHLKHEVDFALKEGVARELSPADALRRPVAKGRLMALHGAVREVVGAHTAADRWLRGEALPERVRPNGPDVPQMARSLKALLRETEDAAVVVEQLRQHPDVEWASLNLLHEPDLTPTDALWPQQWGPQQIGATNAWDVTPASTSIRIAIIDTGVDLTHPDLAARIVYNRGFGSNANGDAKRDRRGGNTLDHGTHVAGIAAAIRNNIGIAGVARANLMAMGCASWNDKTGKYHICCDADAINDAVANGADVINCSFSNPDLTDSLREALSNASSADALVVVAAGNDGQDVDSSPSRGWNDHGWPLIVSNTRANNTLNPGSNFGPAIDLAAPGTAILSTATTNFTAGTAIGPYVQMSGTSMASPHVAGAAAMVRSMNPPLITGSAVKHFLYRTALDLGAAGKDTNFGNGLVQLDPRFLQTLKDADAFLNPNGGGWWPDGTYLLPYTLLSDAVDSEPAGSVLVLNGGQVDFTTYRYPDPVIITKACTLMAFPDRPAVLGEFRLSP
ncbi:MAG TPA: S8 family serine peptidase [Terriglobales bacterium]|nr:S8 family serine peptidase [Terriglobales bacterium]